MRQFETGATRNTDEGKYDYEAFMSPLVIERYAAYMHKNRYQADGKMRDGDNWQKGIPKDAYIKSAWRHFMDWWKEHRGIPTQEGLEQALCAILFNVMGYLHETLKEKHAKKESRCRDWRDVLARDEEARRGIPLTATEIEHNREVLKRLSETGATADEMYGRRWEDAGHKPPEYHTAIPGDAGLEHG